MYGPVHKDQHAFANCYRHAAMPLLRRNEPIHKNGNPLAGFFFAAEWLVGVVRPVFNSAEQRFGIGIVVSHPRAGEGSKNPQLF